MLAPVAGTMQEVRCVRNAWSCMFAMSLAIAAGCSGDSIELHAVRGRVTLDGKPLPGATVTFSPTGGVGGPAYGMTNENGEYELNYSHEKAGAVVGECIVRINTGLRASGADADEPRPKEVVPEKYNTQSELRAAVGPERESYDFDLTTK